MQKKKKKVSPICIKSKLFTSLLKFTFHLTRYLWDCMFPGMTYVIFLSHTATCAGFQGVTFSGERVKGHHKGRAAQCTFGKAIARDDTCQFFCLAQVLPLFTRDSKFVRDEFLHILILFYWWT